MYKSSKTNNYKGLCIRHTFVKRELFNMKKEDAYIKLYNLTFPEDYTDNNYDYHLTPASFSEDNCHVFCVSNGSECRILAAHLNYLIDISRHSLKNIQVKEGILPKKDIIQITNYITQLIE